MVSPNGYRLRALPTLDNVPEFVFPVEVVGRGHFNMLVVWSKGQQKFRYVMGVVKALEMYRELFEACPTVLIGDLNSNAIWNSHHPAGLNHAALINALSSETRPTCNLLWNEKRPCHIDYCFVPTSWAPLIQCVEVGSFGQWMQHSDHRPLLVEIQDCAA